MVKNYFFFNLKKLKEKILKNKINMVDESIFFHFTKLILYKLKL